jgi:hypothetical protein
MDDECAVLRFGRARGHRRRGGQQDKQDHASHALSMRLLCPVALSRTARLKLDANVTSGGVEVPVHRERESLYSRCWTTRALRLTHHAEIIPIEGESYRLREAELAQQARRADEGNDRKRPSRA